MKKFGIHQRNKLLHLFYLEALLKGRSKGFHVRILKSKTALDPNPVADNLFLVAHAQVFDVFLEYLTENNRGRSIQAKIKGIAVLQSLRTNTTANLPNSLVNLSSRFNNAPPPTWVQVESRSLDSGRLTKDVLELEKMTHENSTPSSDPTVNFKRVAEFLAGYNLEVKLAGNEDDNGAAVTSTLPEKNTLALVRGAKTQKTSTWPAEASLPSTGKLFSGAARTSTFPRADSDLYGTRPADPWRTFKVLLQQADTYHSRSQLRDAELRYRDIIQMKPPEITLLSARVSLAVIELQRGRHLQAESALSCIIEEAKEYSAHYEDPPLAVNSSIAKNAQLSPGFILLQDAMLHRATARTRLGLYSKVFTDLKQIVRLSRSKLWSAQDSGDVETVFGFVFKQSELALESRLVQEVAQDASIARLCALSAAYSGCSPEFCWNMMTAATSICSWLETQYTKGSDMAKDTDQEPLQDFLGLRIAIQLTGAKIHMMQGNLAEAKLNVNDAWKGAEENLPNFSTLTLETGLVLAHVSTLTHHFIEARQHCKRLATLTAKHLGAGHPFEMEAEWVLILSATLQGRYVESMITSRRLNDRAASSACLHPLHPLTLKYKSQLAGIYLRLGYYQRAETLLQSLGNQSRELWPDQDGRPNPCTLQYLSQLSLAQCFNGKTTAAEENIQVALRYQQWPSVQEDDGMRCQSSWVGATSEGSGKCLHFHEKNWLHPETMLSILIRGWIEMSKEPPDLEVTRSILSVREHVRPPPGYPLTSEIQLLWSLALGQAQSAEASSAMNMTEMDTAGGKAIIELSRIIKAQRQVRLGTHRSLCQHYPG
jgi:hypothetical protein